MTGVIACLAWGSLCWDARELPLARGWSKDGPVLSIEFARISADRRITLVLTNAGSRVPVLWAPLAVRTMDEAICALGFREGIQAPFNAVGRYPTDGAASADHEVIGGWAEAKGLTGVVWTALKPGLDRKRRGSAPSLEQLCAHIATLTAEERARAFEYVDRTPEQIATSYRSALRAALRPA